MSAHPSEKRYLSELEDLDWFPDTIREGMTDYLRYLFNALNIYRPITGLIKEGIDRTGSTRIIDCCSGGGGAIELVQKNIHEQYGLDIPIVLTDKFPNINAFEFIRSSTNGKISYIPTPVDAANVPGELKGFRTVFSAFHHFDPPTGRSVLKNAVDAKQGIGIFDGGDKNFFVILGLMIFHPLAILVCTPFFRPFRWSRLLFTYIIPLIPLCTVWDGIVSILHLYRPAEMLKIAHDIPHSGYSWKAGKIKTNWGMNIAYLIGYPNTP